MAAADSSAAATLLAETMWAGKVRDSTVWWFNFCIWHIKFCPFFQFFFIQGWHPAPRGHTAFTPADSERLSHSRRLLGPSLSRRLWKGDCRSLTFHTHLSGSVMAHFTSPEPHLATLHFSRREWQCEIAGWSFESLEDFFTQKSPKVAPENSTLPWAKCIPCNSRRADWKNILDDFGEYWLWMECSCTPLSDTQEHTALLEQSGFFPLFKMYF